MFYDIFEDLCQQAGTTPARVRKDLGISQSTMASWKSRGLTPKFETIQRIAKVLRVSPAYLMGWEDDFGELDLGLMAIDTGKQQNVPPESASEIIDATIASILWQDSSNPEIFSKVSNSLYKLNPVGQKKVSDYAEDLTKIPEYQAKVSVEDE